MLQSRVGTLVMVVNIILTPFVHVAQHCVHSFDITAVLILRVGLSPMRARRRRNRRNVFDL